MTSYYLSPRTYTWLILITPQGYISFSSTIRGLHGRSDAGILLRRSVLGSEVPFRTPLHAVAVHIHLRRTYTVCSLYLAPGVPTARDDLVELLRQLPEPFILVGDFNIRHLSWDDAVASPNAAMLFSVTLVFSLCCLNSLSSFYWFVFLHWPVILLFLCCSWLHLVSSSLFL